MTSFIERIGKVWFDGQLLDGKQALIPVLTHGLHYVSCVYEGGSVHMAERCSSFESTPTVCFARRH